MYRRHRTSSVTGRPLPRRTTRPPARRRARFVLLAMAMAGGVLPLIAISRAPSASAQEPPTIRPTERAELRGALASTSGNAPAPMIVDSERNLGFVFGKTDAGARMAVYDLARLETVLERGSGFSSSDIHRFAVDERHGRLVGPRSAIGVDTSPRCDPRQGTTLNIFDYTDDGTSVVPGTLNMPCSGSFKFIPLSISIHHTADGTQKVVAAGTYTHEGFRATVLGGRLQHNLGQPLIIRQLDLEQLYAQLDDPVNSDWRDALDWEIDLRYAGCGRWDSSRILIERLGDDLLSYCWDTDPLVRSLGAQGYVVRIPLGDDNRPETTRETPVLPDPMNPSGAAPPLPDVTPGLPPTNAPGLDVASLVTACFAGGGPGNPQGCATAVIAEANRQGVENLDWVTNEFLPNVVPTLPALPDPTDPPEINDDNPTNSAFIANPVAKRIPTFPGPVFPFVDHVSQRLLLLTSNELNGNAVWVFDPVDDRFVGLFTGGVPEENPQKTAAGFDPVAGRAYLVTSRGLLMGSVRVSPLSGQIFDVLGDFEEGGKAFEQTVPAQAVAVAPELGRIFVPVLETEVVENPESPPPPVTDRVRRSQEMVSGVLNAINDPDSDPSTVLAPVVDFIQSDPIGSDIAACVAEIEPGDDLDTNDTEAADFATCLIDVEELLDDDPAIQAVRTCTEGIASPSPSIDADDIQRCQQVLGDYLGTTTTPAAEQEQRGRYLVFEDGVPDPPETEPVDPDSFTVQIDEEEGKTEVDRSGAVQASAAHVLVTGGIPRVANQVDPFCEAPNGIWEQFVPLGERELYGGQCVADQILSSGNREYHLGYVDAETGSGTGASVEASGFFIPLTERPTDEDIRNFGSCGTGSARRLATPMTSQDDEFAEGFDRLLGGVAQVCDPVQGGAAQVLGDDLRNGTRGGTDAPGEGFPVPSATCNDFGGAPATDRAPDDPKRAAFSATASCDAAGVSFAGQAVAAAPITPAAVSPFVSTGRLWSDARSTLTPLGQLTTVVSVAENVRIGPVPTQTGGGTLERDHVGPLLVGSIRTAATTVAKGRTGTAGASFERQWCGVQFEEVVAVAGCTDPATDPQIQSALEDINQGLGKVRVTVPDASTEATPGGFQSVATKHPDERAAAQAINEDDSHTVPGVQVVVFNDGAEGRSRIVTQLAGVHGESRYGIVPLPTFNVPDFPDVDRSPLLGDLLVPPTVDAAGVRTIEEPTRVVTIGNAPGSPPDNPLAQFFNAPVQALQQFFGWLINNPAEAALLFLLLSLLASPLYLTLRARAAARVLQD